MTIEALAQPSISEGVDSRRGARADSDSSLQVTERSTTFMLGREMLLPSGPSHMARWRQRLYGLLARNAPSATVCFEIPPNRAVERGAHIEL